jgi:hypothetical protein
MSHPTIRDAQLSFAGGINTVSDDIALQPDQIRLAENARLNEYGAVEKRGGTVKVSTNAPSASAVQNGYGWVRDNGSAYSLVIANGTFYYLQFAQGASLPAASWSTATGSFASAVVPTFSSFISGGSTDVVYIADGGLLNKWDGTSLVTNISGTQDCAYIKVHNQRLWGAGSTNYPDSIFYSALNDGDSLGNGSASGGQIVVRTFSDERVVGLASVGSSLLIFHRRGISRLTGFGQDDISVKPEGVSSQTGTIGALSIVETDGAAYFLSDRGAFVATEGGVSPLGSPTSPDPLLPLVRELSTTELQNVRGVLSRNTQEIWWWIPGQGVYTYHLILKAWSGPWNGSFLNTAAMWTCNVNTEAEQFVVHANSDSKHVTICDYAGSYVDEGTFAAPATGTDIAMAVQLRRLYFNDESQAKSLKFGYVTAVLAGSSSLNVLWSTDSSSGSKAITASAGGTWGSGYWGTGTWGVVGSKNYRIQMWGTGYYVDVRFEHTSANRPVISRWQEDAFVLGRR